MNRKGIVYGLLSYFLWGVLPIYWSSVTGVNAFEILANRIFGFNFYDYSAFDLR